MKEQTFQRDSSLFPGNKIWERVIRRRRYEAQEGRTLERIGERTLTPHSCRHTFHRLLERAGVGEADRKRLMGHSLKEDITNGVYGHRGAEEIRTEIEKIDATAA